MPRYSRSGRAPTGTQRRWGRRVRKQARKEIVRLAETKRYWVTNDVWNNLTAPSVGSTTGSVYIVNAFAPPPGGVADNQFIGNQIVDPLVVLNLTLSVNWWDAHTHYAPRIPTYRVAVYLIGFNDGLSIPTPRSVTNGESESLFLTQPNTSFRWMLNKQNLVIIKRRVVTFTPKNLVYTGTGAPFEVKTLKMKKRFKGKKTYEQSITNPSGTLTQLPVLRGWNFYWMVVSNQGTAPTATTGGFSPLVISGDRYMYFKDL